MAFEDSRKDLDVVLENYADGLAGTGLFEQSSLFGLKTDTARQYTTFIVSKKATHLGPLAAIRGVVEVADVEKLRLDPQHRDSKAELRFARVKYLGESSATPFKNSLWPVVTHDVNGVKDYAQVRTGLLVIGYYDDAARFESHLKDFHALLRRLTIPASAVPDFNDPPTIPVAPASTPEAPESPAPAASAGGAAPAAPQTPTVEGPAPSSPAAKPEASALPASPPVKPESSALPGSPPAAKPEAPAAATKTK